MSPGRAHTWRALFGGDDDATLVAVMVTIMLMLMLMSISVTLGITLTHIKRDPQNSRPGHSYKDWCAIPVVDTTLFETDFCLYK